MSELDLPGIGPAVLATAWSEFTVGTILMGMRVYTNGFIIRRWSSDFWWALATYVFSVLATVFLTVSVEFGLGDHLKDLVATSPESVSTNQFHQWLFTTCAITSIALGKLAIISFILQIEGTSQGSKRKWILYVFAVSNILVNVIIIPIIWVQCTPTAKMWNEALEGNCRGRARNQMYGYFQGSFGAFLDLALALYPIIIFWNLQLRLHVKIGLMVLFGFGVVAATCAAIKTRQLSTLTATSDITFQLASLNIWASTEMWIVFIVSCIPTVRPIFVKVINKVTSSNNRTFPTDGGYKAQNDTTVSSGARAYNSTKKIMNSRMTSITAANDSEENILPGQSGIMMTTDIHIQRQKSKEDLKAIKSKDEDLWKTRYDDRV